MALLKNWRLIQQSSEHIFRFRHLLQNSRKAPKGWTVLSSNWCALHACRLVHGSPAFRGLEEFFPKGDLIEDGEKSGRQWEARELRQKSNEDLHKLWYVLLKERNMLMTVKHEARRTGFIMPAPERMWKVRKSMARIMVVLGERAKSDEEGMGIIKDQPGQRLVSPILSSFSACERAIAGAKEMMKTGKRTEEPDDKSSDSENLATDDTSDPRSVAQ